MRRRAGKLGVVVGLFGLIACAGLPAAASPATGAASQGTMVRTSPLAVWPGSTSTNWSGYAGVAPTGVKLTYAAGTWIVPSVKPITGFSSSWVGIDGANNNNLIQTGTEQDFVNGHFVYRAWWEILPAAETVIRGMVVQPGDQMFGSVQDISGKTWVINLKDLSRGESFSIHKNYAGPGKSVEWIQEAPTGGGILPLAHYSTTTFSNALIAENFRGAANPHLAYPAMAIAMTNSSGTKIISIPSRPSAAGNAFRVAFGNVQPPAP
jgi:hypothetical protein